VATKPSLNRVAPPVSVEALRARWEAAFDAALAALRCAGSYLPPEELSGRAGQLEAERALTNELLQVLAQNRQASTRLAPRAALDPYFSVHCVGKRPDARAALPTDAGGTERKEDTMETILIATDGSPSAREAVEFGLALAYEQGAEAIVAHVVPAYDVLPVSGFALSGALPHVRTPADTAPLEEATRIAKDLSVHTRSKLLTGNPVDEIVAYADAIDADLIVVGSRGHGAIATTLVGSVSRGALHEARRPVLVVRGQALHEWRPFRAAYGNPRKTSVGVTAERFSTSADGARNGTAQTS
jgi:nucleotide-binding universal stress UspA family protein